MASKLWVGVPNEPDGGRAMAFASMSFLRADQLLAGQMVPTKGPSERNGSHRGPLDRESAKSLPKWLMVGDGTTRALKLCHPRVVTAASDHFYSVTPYTKHAFGFRSHRSVIIFCGTTLPSTYFFASASAPTLS